MNKRQIINKILHAHIDVNHYEDYTNYKRLITSIEDWHKGDQREVLAAFYEYLNNIKRPLKRGNGYKEVDEFTKLEQ